MNPGTSYGSVVWSFYDRLEPPEERLHPFEDFSTHAAHISESGSSHTQRTRPEWNASETPVNLRNQPVESGQRGKHAAARRSCGEFLLN